MKMFVWNKDVLTDYGDGMVCVLAKDLDHAYEQLANKVNYKHAGNYKHDAMGKKPDMVFENEGVAELFGSA